VQQTKSQVRGSILAARRGLTRQTRAAEAEALTGHLLAALEPAVTVCAYVPVGSEPGSVELLDALVERGATVLLPIAREDADGTPRPLQWARYRPGDLRAAPFGLREPPGPWLPAERIADASVILVPALAVDRYGVRLGRGAGFYDRTLPLADPAARLVAMVRDDEFLDDTLPREAHDVPMTHALTPGKGLVAIGDDPGECLTPAGGSST
jgi:5-formyltetrahydrofolate cyclo-ligase